MFENVNRRRLRAALPVALLLTPLGAVAQTPPDTFRLDPILVTATRVPLPRASVSAAVTVLDGATLRARGIRFVAEALEEAPGVTLVRTGAEGGLTSLFLRGGESDYVRVMVDGVVLNDPGGAFDFGQLTMDNVERIEIVRGPASVLYGSDAVTGVVHILTRRGGHQPHVSASVGMGRSPRLNGGPDLCPGYPAQPCPAGADLGGYGTRTWTASAEGHNLVAWSVATSRFDSDGAYAFNNDYRNRALSGRIAWSNDAAELNVTGRYTDGLFHFPTDGAGRLADHNQFRSSESSAVGIDGGWHVVEGLEARLNLSFHEADYVVDDRPDTPADTLGFYASKSANRIDRSRAEVTVHARPGAGAILTFGGEVERQRGLATFASQSQFGPFDSSSRNERTNRAAFAQLIAPISPLTITVGGRTEDNDRFGGLFTWRGGATLRVGGVARLRVAAGTGFKEPTFFEHYAEGFTRGNPQLQPEESRSIEVGAERDFLDGRARIGVTAFDQRFRNLIQYTAQPPEPGAPNYFNIGEARSAGVEIEGTLAARGGAAVNMSWTYTETDVLDEGFGQDALFQQGQPLLRRPRQRLHVEAASPVGARVHTGASLSHVGARHDLDFLESFSGTRVQLAPYTTVGAHASVRLLGVGTESLQLRARVDNLFGADIVEIVHFPSRGRRVEIGLAGSVGF